MPAETHQRGEPVDGATVLELIWMLAARPGSPAIPDPASTLRQLDLDDELAVLQIWEACAEEFAERTLAEPDLEALCAATTVADLSQLIADSLLSC
jgi:hypothetical protein